MSLWKGDTLIAGGGPYLKNQIGELNKLTTDDKGNLVNAINEVKETTDNLSINIGNLEDLTTEDKSSIVNAVNEIKSNNGLTSDSGSVSAPNTGAGSSGGSLVLPVGVIMPTASPVIPGGWLLCDGSEVYRKTYPELFAALGTYHGAGDGVNTFNLPDMRNRTPIGISDETVVATTTCNRLQTSVTITATADFKFKYKAGDTITFGSENRTITSISIVNATALTYKIDFDASFTGDIAINDTLKIFNTVGCVGGEAGHTLTVSEMPSHSHSSIVSSENRNSGSYNGYTTASGSTGSTGGDQAHNNMQPYTTVNYIIYAGQKTEDDGEQVTIKLPDTLTNIPETNVRLINDSDNSLNKTLTISSESPIVTAIIPVGDNYHVEYSDISGYLKPNNTISKKAIANEMTEITIDYIPTEYNLNIVTILNNSNIRVYRENYEISINTGESNSVTISLPSGEWNIEVVDIDCKETEIVTLDSDYTLDFNTRILGIKRDITSTDPAWERTHSSIGKTVVASMGNGTSTTVWGYSDFDTTAIYSRIKRVTLPTNDVMVEIPKFYYKRYIEDNIEYIQISYGAQEGFELHPAFNHGNVIKDKIYVSAYLVGESTMTDTEGTSVTILDSIAGSYESYNQTLTNFRTKAMAKGDGWALWDMSTLSAIQILMLVEFATYNVRTVLGKGLTSFAYKRGDYSDKVYKLTGTTATSANSIGGVVWRGIEHIYGSDRKWIDGILIDTDNKIYVCNDITKYSDTITEDYIEIPNYVRPLAQALVTTIICEPTMSYIMLPQELSGTTYETYTCSRTEFITASYVQALVYEAENEITASTQNGLMSYGDTRPTSYDSYTSTRLIYIPQEEE